MLDYHVHTRLCNHADGTIGDYVRQAVSLGLKEICFLDHLTLGDRGSNSSMAIDEVGLYHQTVQHIKRATVGQINVKVGLETDFDPQYIDLYREIVQAFSFDVIGCSIHALDAIDVVSAHTDWADGRLDSQTIYTRYFERLNEMLDQDYFDLICHFDLVKKFGRVPKKSFQPEIEAIIEKIKRKKIVVEVNTSGFAHAPAEPYPAMPIIQMLADAGVGLTMGSDAHRPEELGRYFDQAAESLKRVGVKNLVGFSNRVQHAVPLLERDLH
jgi:histidinol-phosphatase (PHP family)